MTESLVDAGQSLLPAITDGDMPVKEALLEQSQSEPQTALPTDKEDAQPMPSPSEATAVKRQRTDNSAGLLPNGLATPQKSSEDAELPATVPGSPQPANGIAEEDAKQEVSLRKQVAKIDEVPSTSGQSGPVSLCS